MIKVLSAGIIALAIFGTGFLYSEFRRVIEPTPLQGIASAPSYATATSSAATIGHQLSTRVLEATGTRGYAVLCNYGPNRAFLSLSSTAITATSSADIFVPANTCYEFDQDNLYTGEVQAMQETATTTTLLVTELRNN